MADRLRQTGPWVEEKQHEPSDARVGKVLAAAGALLIIIIIVLGILWGFTLFFSDNYGPLSLATPTEPQTVPPPPRLQVSPPQDLQTLQKKYQSILHSYAWVDRDKGIVRIPIERAMELLAQEESEKGETAEGKQEENP